MRERLLKVQFCQACDQYETDSATACSRCGGPLARAIVDSPKARRPIWPLYAVCGIALGWYLLSHRDTAPEPTKTEARHAVSPTAPSVPAPTRKTDLKPGVSGTLSRDVLVARSRADLAEFTKLSVASDKIGVARMVARDLLFPAQLGTGAHIVERGFGCVRIRVLGGHYAGADGWIAEEFFSPLERP